MVNWARFTPADFEYDFERDELAAHRVTFEEAVECFFSDFEIRRNKSYRDRYQLLAEVSYLWQRRGGGEGVSGGKDGEMRAERVRARV